MVLACGGRAGPGGEDTAPPRALRARPARGRGGGRLYAIYKRTEPGTRTTRKRARPRRLESGSRFFSCLSVHPTATCTSARTSHTFFFIWIRIRAVFFFLDFAPWAQGYKSGPDKSNPRACAMPHTTHQTQTKHTQERSHTHTCENAPRRAWPLTVCLVGHDAQRRAMERRDGATTRAGDGA